MENDKPRHLLKEYLAVVARLWGKQISGPVLAVVSLVLTFLYAHYADNAEVGTKLVRYSAWVTGAVSLFLIFVAQYEAWKSEREALEAETLKNVGSDVQGKILFGYLDFRVAEITFVAGGTRLAWSDLPSDKCYVNFWVEVVNHNPLKARFKPLESQVELRIGGKCFYGAWNHAIPGLAVNDERRQKEYRRLVDFFDGLFDGTDGLRQGVQWIRYVGFVVEGFDRALVADKGGAVHAGVKIMLKDTLDKVHSLEVNDLELLIGRLCETNDLEKKA
jgi:hypothetical protein